MTLSTGGSTTSLRSLSYQETTVLPSTVKQAKRQPMLVYTGNCDDCDPIPSIVGSIFCSLYGILTCCKCCSGDCCEAFSYQKLPFCKKPLEPNEDMDILAETSLEDVQQKLVAAREQLGQLDETLNTRRKVHRCASTLLCPIVCLPRSIDCVIDTLAEMDDYPQNQRPSPETQLDLMYQFTLPCLERNEERGRLGLRQFLSPPELQRMVDLETAIIPGLENKATLLASDSQNSH